MSDVLLIDEPILKGVRRILVERLEHIGKVLESHPLSDDNVHAIRKDLKRARASVRLLHEALGVAEYRRLNKALRDAARPLSLMRDASVLLHTLDAALEQIGDASLVAIADELRRSLQQELSANRAELKARDIAAIRRRLETVKQSVHDLSGTRLNRTGAEAAIKRAHKKSRKAFKAAKCEASAENLHEWRKQVKYELNQLQLLLPLNPKRIGAIIRKAQKLADKLGDDHDLVVLHDRIIAQSSQAKTAAAIANSDALLTALKPLRDRLQRKAYRVGKLLYGRKSRRKFAKILAALD